MLFEYTVAVVLIQRYYFCTTILLQKLLKNILLLYKANVIIILQNFIRKLNTHKYLRMHYTIIIILYLNLRQ